MIRLSKSVLGDEEVRALASVVLEDGYLGMGKEVNAFEEELTGFLGGVKIVVCVNSGTAALHLAVASVVRPGDEVLVQSLTFVSSFQSISASGATPVACEIDPLSMTIDLDDAEKKLTNSTKAIMPVHYAGNPGHLDEVYEFAGRHGLRVVEDAAHAFGSTYKGKRVGSIGDIVCFSFDGIKNITSGEGGAIVSSDADVIQYVQDARLLGIHKDTEQRYSGKRSWEFDVTHQGYRYHMSNLFAAIGRVQLRRFPTFMQARQSLATRYDDSLRRIDGIGVFDFDYRCVVPHIYPITVKHERKDALREFLIKSGVECGVHYYPNHLLTFYETASMRLPVTEQVYGEILTLPLHPDLTLRQQDKVVSLIREFMGGRDA